MKKALSLLFALLANIAPISLSRLNQNNLQHFLCIGCYGVTHTYSMPDKEVALILSGGSWTIQKSIINAEKHIIPIHSTWCCLLTSSFFHYPLCPAYLTGSEYDPVVVLRSIFFDFFWLLSSYTHSYWAQVLICTKIVPVFLYMRERKEKVCLTSYTSTIFSRLIVTPEINCQVLESIRACLQVVPGCHSCASLLS